MSAKGDVFYVIPVSEKEIAHYDKKKEEKKDKKVKKGSKLSRLVRRRESKRERGSVSQGRNLANVSHGQVSRQGNYNYPAWSVS